jgi:hypothetical protein
MAIFLTGALTSCTKNLNREPANTNTADIQYATATGYKQVLAKVYGSYALISSQGTAPAISTSPASPTSARRISSACCSTCRN